ncbi:hypothetical protein B0H21DRAFT_357215 [Amylocystis lapponica]|nr:hypothetical protein B0H21DRAFT_357215 [Amylocystis lapponica]
MQLPLFNILAWLASGVVFAVGFAEGISIPISPTGQILSQRADILESKATSFPSDLHVCNSDDDTCQVDAWKWMTSIGGTVQTNAEEQLKNIATSLNVFDEYKAAVGDVISSAKQQLDAVDLHVMTNDVEAALMVLFTELEAEFPTPESALGHDERVTMMSNVMTQARGTILHVGLEHGIAEESLTKYLDIMCPKMVGLVVLVGDLAEQHPVLLEVLLLELAGAVLIIPEGALLRLFLGMFGFGSRGPVKGSVAAWAQRTFFDAAIPKESWFSQLQRVAMTLGHN